MVTLGRLCGAAGALLMPLALSMPFVGLKNELDDDTVYKDVSGWELFGAADIVLAAVAVGVLAAVALAHVEDYRPLAGLVAFGCGFAALALAIAESVSPADISEDVEVLRYGAQFVVIAAALQGVGGGLMLVGAFEERIDAAIGLR